jgi:hypothetical protein
MVSPKDQNPFIKKESPSLFIREKLRNELERAAPTPKSYETAVEYSNRNPRMAYESKGGIVF